MAFERIDDHLSFDPEMHRFQLDGRPVPSVTQVLKGAGLIDDRWFSEYTANRGQQVHLACQLYDENDLDEETLDPVLAGYLEGWKRFRAETGVEITLIERHVYSVCLQYAGILDRCGFINEESTIIDIKSGAVPWWVGAQMSAYQNTLDPPPKNRLAVQLTPEGKYNLHWFKDRHDWHIFKCCLEIEHLKRRHNGKS